MGSSLLLANLYKNTSWRNWVITYQPKNFVFRKHVVLGFWNTKLMHLGDQLFYIGLIKSLQDSEIKVSIAGKTPLKKLFKNMGVSFLSTHELSSNHGIIVLSKDDYFIEHLKLNKNNAFLGVNYRFTKSKERIGEILFNTTKNFLERFKEKISMEQKNWDISLIIPIEKPHLKLHQSTILYNDFVASNMIDAAKRLPVIKRLGEVAAKRDFVIYAGSSEDKKKCPPPDFISKDLRGEFKVSELFSLVEKPQIKAIITFDTLWAHMGILLNKKTLIVNRQKNNQDKIWNRFIPMSKYLTSEIEKY